MGKIKTNVGYAIHKRYIQKKMICEGQKILTSENIQHYNTNNTGNREN